jgi:5-methylcytosine-specific restriction endonuclease McrA
MQNFKLPLIGGHHVGPLFEINKKRPLVRQKGREGVIHRAQTKRRTPPWADMDAIRAIYKEAKRLCELTGEAYVVDHIVPKCGKIVSGLHLPWNLRIIHWLENARKGAHTWPDMPNEQMELF